MVKGVGFGRAAGIMGVDFLDLERELQRQSVRSLCLPRDSPRAWRPSPTFLRPIVKTELQSGCRAESLLFTTCDLRR